MIAAGSRSVCVFGGAEGKKNFGSICTPKKRTRLGAASRILCVEIPGLNWQDDGIRVMLLTMLWVLVVERLNKEWVSGQAMGRCLCLVPLNFKERTG
jgi:hypothetical protein